MINGYARMAVTLADLDYQPFPDPTEAIPELAEVVRLHTSGSLPAQVVGEQPRSTPRFQRKCEGGDLNPYGVTR